MKLSEFKDSKTFDAKKMGEPETEQTSKREDAQNYEKFERQAKELQNSSHDELMQKLLQEVRDQKARGVFDFDALVGGIEALKPMLGQQAYEDLISIVEKFR